MRILRALCLATAVITAAGCAAAEAASPARDGVLTIGMTAGDIPLLDTMLSANQGYEGTRFVGNQLYDGLTRFDLKQAGRTPPVVPGLATSWTPNKDATSWTFRLRHGVRFHDGTRFDAAAVVYNLDRYLNKKAAQFYPELAAQGSIALGGIKAYRALDPYTVQIGTNGPWSHLPADLTSVFMASPTAVKKYGNAGFGAHPSGTGPFRFASQTRGQRLRLLRNDAYWGGAPKVRELDLEPIPDTTSRIAALTSGQVDWIEAPDPDDLHYLRSHGFRIRTNSYDHVWPWIFDTSRTPWNDKRVRQAANYAIDREAMATKLLLGTADPAYQLAPRANAAYRTAADAYSYDPAKARRLLRAAGYPHGFTTTVSYPTGGSGNMQPAPMNQELQSDLAKVGIRVELKPIEWATMLTSFTSGKFPDGADAMNISLAFIQESFWSLLFASKSPLNVAHYRSPRVDALFARAIAEPDETRRYRLYAQAAAQITDDAPWLFIVNDRNPRALAPRVHGFIEPKSWFVDLTTVSVS